jgi:hypothetical protein
MLVHPYEGIFHDANLYTLQALAHLHPDSLTHDVFLKFGSQDRFTLFSPLFAASITVLGVDHAAALLTLLSQLALFIGGWCLARAVMPREYALLGLGFMIAMPGYYGPGRIFACVEPFLTPRLSAEALVLGAMALAFSGRRSWCIAVLAAALALHPVMGAAGIVFLIAGGFILPHPRLAIPLMLLTGAGLLLAASVNPSGEWGRLDADWLKLALNRSPFLFLSFWQIDDWGRAAVALATLIAGSVGVDSPLRVLCRASVLTMIGGFVLSWAACDSLHLTAFTQMQPWRWEWVGVITAALSLPMLVVANWKLGYAGRATALFLISGWIFGTGEFAAITCLTAVLSLTFGRLRPREQRLVCWGSCAVLGLALLWRIASNLEFTDVLSIDVALPLWLRRCMSFTRDGCAAAALLSTVAWIISRPHRPFASTVCALTAVVAMFILFPFAWTSRTRQEFPPSQYERFADWRQIIAPDANVFWSESALSSWVLLNRSNYLSAVQTAGMIFSRQSALEMERRALTLRDYIGQDTFLVWSTTSGHLSLSPEQLRGICQRQAFNYLVTNTDLGMPPVAVMDTLKLYRCAAQARAAAAAT